MSRTIKLALILFLLMLIGCNRPQLFPDLISTDTGIISDPTDSAGSNQEATQTYKPEITKAASTAESTTTQQPPLPTEDTTVILEGDPIPLLPAGTMIIIHKVDMIDLLNGIALTKDSQDRDHILQTADGGYTWRDITPPQPYGPDSHIRDAEVKFANDKNGWAAYTGSDLVWSTEDGGITWSVRQLTHQTLVGNLLISLDQNHVWLYQFFDGGMQNVYTALSSTNDKGQNWTTLFDPSMDTGGNVQGFDKTGGVFANTEYGWLTRDFRGVTISVSLEITADGGSTWQNLELPAPPTDPDIFSTCACGMYDPSLVNTAVGSARLSCKCYLDDLLINKNFLYRTIDGGSSWVIESMPFGQMHFISGQTYYTVGREIYLTSDSGDYWDLVKTVNWDGQFSFVDLHNALAVAYDPEDDEYALVKTTDGCRSFEIIIPELLRSLTIR
jgi:hypothetical protein